MTKPFRIILPMEAAVSLFACEEGISKKDLFSDSRERSVAWARQNVMRRLSEECGYSSTQIGKILARDHSTVLYGIKKSRERKEAEEKGKAI